MANDLIDMAVNPLDKTQRVLLFRNGRMEAIGGVPQPTQGPTGWLNSPRGPARAIVITQWTDPVKGHILDQVGGLHTVGGETALTGTTHPIVQGQGVVYTDLILDPSDPTEFYVLRISGRVYPGGGASSISQVSTVGFTGWYARQFSMEFPSRKFYVLYTNGKVAGGNGAISPVSLGPQKETVGKSSFRALLAVDYDGEVLKLGRSGIIWEGGAPPLSFIQGGPQYLGEDIARTFVLVSDVAPRQWAIHLADGTEQTWFESTAPTVTISEPADTSTVTGTSAPLVEWVYGDAEQDLQASWELRLFSGGSPDPDTDTPAQTATGTRPDDRSYRLDAIDNGTWTVAVRVVDTSGLTSSWATSTWTQSVTAPSAPTSATATASSAGDLPYRTLAATVPLSTDLAQWQRTLDSGSTWEAVRGAQSVATDGTTATSYLDYEVPIGVAVDYRVRTVRGTDAEQIVSAWTTVTGGTLTGTTYGSWIHPDTQTTLGARARVAAQHTRTHGILAETHRPEGATHDVVLTDDTLRAPAIELRLYARTPAESAGIAAMLGGTGPWLLRMADSTTRWVGRTADVTAETVDTPAGTWVRAWTMPVVEVDTPADPSELTLDPVI